MQPLSPVSPVSPPPPLSSSATASTDGQQLTPEQLADIDRLKQLLNKHQQQTQQAPTTTLRSASARYIRKERCTHVCPISGEEIPPQYVISMVSNDKVHYYNVQYLLQALEHDRLLRDPITRISYPFSELQRVRLAAAHAGLSVASDAVLQTEHELRKLFDHVLTVTNYQNMASCHEDISRQVSDLCDFLRGRTEESKAYAEQDRIQVARLRADSAERHWRQRVAELLEPQLQLRAANAMGAGGAAAPFLTMPDPMQMLVGQFLAPPLPPPALHQRRRVAYFSASSR
jgi:hypothetical protein